MNSYFRVVICTVLVTCQFTYSSELRKDKDSIYICSFNVFRLGDIESKYDILEENEPDADESDLEIPERIKNLARVLAVGDFDLIVLQEVTHGDRGQWAISDLVRELKTAHATEYKYFLSDHIGRGLMEEAIAFIYKPDKVSLIPFDNKPSKNIKIPGRHLVATNWIVGDFDFTLVSAHLAWGNKEHREKGDKEILKILTNPKDYSDDPDIIVLGDLNRFGLGYTFFDKVSYNPSLFLAPNIAIFDPQFNSIKQVRRSDILGKGIPQDNPQFLSTTVASNTSVYDVFLMTPDVDEEFPGSGNQSVFGEDFGIIHFDEPGGFGYQAGAEMLSQNKLKEAYSDHRPLWFRFKVNSGSKDSMVSNAPITTGIHNNPTFVTTETGRKFHRPDCKTLKSSASFQTWLSRGDVELKYGPCSVCKP